jgi:hypothetical protein
MTKMIDKCHFLLLLMTIPLVPEMSISNPKALTLLTPVFDFVGWFSFPLLLALPAFAFWAFASFEDDATAAFAVRLPWKSFLYRCSGELIRAVELAVPLA